MQMKETQQIKSLEPIKIDEEELIEEIKKNFSYKKEGLKLTRWGGQLNSQNYLAQYKDGHNSFMGIVNSSMQKDGFGCWTYENGEKYFGVFDNDLFNKHGIYKFATVEGKDGKNQTEFYFGLFKDGQKNDHGVYLWLYEDKSIPMFSSFDQSDFDCYVGNIEKEHFTHGTYLTKKKDKYFVYHGGFNKTTGKKEGKYSFYYNAQNDTLLYGKVSNDNFENAYIAIFDENGYIKDNGYAEFNENGTIKNVKKKEEMEENKEAMDEMLNFRNLILAEDYFGDIYMLFKRTTEFLAKHLTKWDFDSQEKFPNLMQISFEFNKAKIYNDIECVLKLYEKENAK